MKSEAWNTEITTATTKAPQSAAAAAATTTIRMTSMRALVCDFVEQLKWYTFPSKFPTVDTQ